MKGGWLIAGAAGLTMGMAIEGTWLANKQEHALDANLYMQTSAEYRAVCLQTYQLASERLGQRLSTLPTGSKRPAVVMDLDETVVDNAAYQSYLDKADLNYSDAEWERYEKDFPKEVRLIPGSKAFIQRAESMGVAVVYLSNRLTKYRESTLEALANNGIDLTGIDERLLLKETTSDKTERRKIAGERFNIVMFVGDNLRDFSEEFAAPKLDYTAAANREAAVAGRWSKVDANAHRFGAEWIVLPNPVYGEWQKPLGPDARANLRSTAMNPSGS